MNTDRTREFIEANEIELLVADYTSYSAEIKQLMQSLGNEAAAIPFYAIFPGDGRPPMTFQDIPLLQSKVIERLEWAISPAQNVAAPMSDLGAEQF